METSNFNESDKTPSLHFYQDESVVLYKEETGGKDGESSLSGDIVQKWDWKTGIKFGIPCFRFDTVYMIVPSILNSVQLRSG